MTLKQKRQDRLKMIISSNKAGNQEDILSMLAQDGFRVTQATLSRDLKELKVAKVPDTSGGYHYRLQQQSVTTDVAQDTLNNSSSFIRSVEFSGQMGVIRTVPGYANMVGAILDSALEHKIMGTIAGDDTVLLILRSGTDYKRLLADLEISLPGISVRRI